MADTDSKEQKGGKPSKGTPKDGRLSANKPGGKPAKPSKPAAKPFPGAAAPFKSSPKPSPKKGK